jgi:hypothetical protein
MGAPNYIRFTAAGAPGAKVLELNNNTTAGFQLSIRAPAGVTVEFALEDLFDPTEQPPSGAPVGGPTWVAAPNAVNANGVLHLSSTPYRLCRLTPTTGAEVVTMLQQGTM